MWLVPQIPSIPTSHCDILFVLVFEIFPLMKSEKVMKHLIEHDTFPIFTYPFKQAAITVAATHHCTCSGKAKLKPKPPSYFFFFNYHPSLIVNNAAIENACLPWHPPFFSSIGLLESVRNTQYNYTTFKGCRWRWRAAWAEHGVVEG